MGRIAHTLMHTRVYTQHFADTRPTLVSTGWDRANKCKDWKQVCHLGSKAHHKLNLWKPCKALNYTLVSM